MPNNEGHLGTHSISSEKIYSEVHPPVILTGKLSADYKDILPGSVLSCNNDGELSVISAGSTLQIAGVSLEEIKVSDKKKYINYIAHGIVKAEALKGAGGTKWAETAKLKTVGIYAE